MMTNNDATENMDKNYDIYVTMPCLSGFLELENNFGRVYVCGYLKN